MVQHPGTLQVRADRPQVGRERAAGRRQRRLGARRPVTFVVGRTGTGGRQDKQPDGGAADEDTHL